MFSIIGLLTGLINPVSAITKQIADAYAARARADSNQAKIAADVQIKTLEARRDVLVAESHHPLNTIFRGILTLPAAILLWKVLVWDKALGQWTQGRTDGLSPELWQVIMIILGFYFIAEIVQRWRR